MESMESIRDEAQERLESGPCVNDCVFAEECAAALHRGKPCPASPEECLAEHIRDVKRTRNG